METSTISLKESNYFSSLMLDYINQKDELKPFYNRFPKLESYIEQSYEKLKSYKSREILVQQLNMQLSGLHLSAKQVENLKVLSQENTVTITTGHQLNLFTGPIFFFYKILQIIKQCEELNHSQSEIKFVPIFWMATEDHDFEEINHFKFQDRVFHWDKQNGGPVGELSTDGLQDVFKSYLSLFPNGKKKDQLKSLIEKSYCNAENLADATRKLVHELFSDYGLLFIDGNDTELKKLMIPNFEKELIQQKSFEKVLQSSEKLKKLNYSIQVNPREINLFYIAHPLSRERIVFENDRYSVLNTSLTFTKEEIIQELHQFPEKFSPNVILRPLYQETILPNVAYIGGGGELAYWLELKEMFEDFDTTFPLLVLRNSLLIRTKKQLKKQLALNLNDKDLFTKSRNFVKEKVEQESELIQQLPHLKNDLIELFKKMEEIAQKTDQSFGNMVQAQKSKQLNGFEKLEKRLIKAEIKTQKDYLDRIENLLFELTQDKSLQERVRHFSDFDYVDVKEFIASIYKSIQPFEFNFIINTLAEDI